MKIASAWLLLAALAPFAAGCAVTPPTAPSVVALPPQGKDLTQFQHEDESCRQYAAGRIASETAPGHAATSTEQVQRDYDIAYGQCMATNGNRMDFYPMSFAPSYAYPYPAYYDPWWGWGPGLGFGFVTVVNPRFHHHGFHNHMGVAHSHFGGGHRRG